MVDLETIEKKKQEGNDFFKQKQYRKAIEAFNEGLEMIKLFE